MLSTCGPTGDRLCQLGRHRDVPIAGVMINEFPPEGGGRRASAIHETTGRRGDRGRLGCSRAHRRSRVRGVRGIRGSERQGRYLPRRLGVHIRLVRQLRPDRRVPRELHRDLHEPARANPGRVQPRGRHRRGHAGAGSGDCHPQADERWQDVDIPPQERYQVRSAGQPRDHLERHQVRARPSRGPEERRAVRVLLQRDQGLRGGREGRGAVGLRHQDAERQDDRVQSHEASRRLPAAPGHAGCRPDPSRGGRLLQGEAG